MRLVETLNSAKNSVDQSASRLSLVKIENDILSDTARTAVVMISKNGKIAQVNHHFKELFAEDYPGLEFINNINFLINEKKTQGVWLDDLMTSDEKVYPKVQTSLKGTTYYFTVMLTKFHAGEDDVYIVTMTDITKVVELHLKEVEISKELAYKQGIFDITSEYIHNIGNIVTGAKNNIERIEANLNPLGQFATFFDRIKTENRAIKEGVGETGEPFAKAFQNIEAGLTIIQGTIEDIAKNTVNEDVTKLRIAIENIAKTISYQQEMYKQTSSQSVVSEDVNVEELLKEVMDSVSDKTQKYDVDIRLKVESGLCVSFNKINLFNGILNLVTNSIYAVDKAASDGMLQTKKHIDIISYVEEIEDDGFFELDAFDDDGIKVEQNVIIMVCDNGIGIAQETLEKMFVRGFTTKKEGHGLGLHSFANFLKEHNGDISVSSDGVGKGACFTVTIKQKVTI